MILQFKKIYGLILKDFLLERKNQNTFLSSLLFLAITTYLSYLLMLKINVPIAWLSLFWVVHTFSGFNLIITSAGMEKKEQFYYIQQLISPSQYYISKTLFYFLQLSTLGIITVLLWNLLGLKSLYLTKIFIPLLLHSAIFSSILVLTVLMNNKTSGGFGLLLIVSMPLLIPEILIISKVSQNIIQSFEYITYKKLIYSQALLMIISFTLCYILFPYLWKD